MITVRLYLVAIPRMRTFSQMALTIIISIGGLRRTDGQKSPNDCSNPSTYALRRGLIIATTNLGLAGRSAHMPHYSIILYYIGKPIIIITYAIGVLIQ